MNLSSCDAPTLRILLRTHRSVLKRMQQGGFSQGAINHQSRLVEELEIALSNMVGDVDCATPEAWRLTHSKPRKKERVRRKGQNDDKSSHRNVLRGGGLEKA